MVTELRFPAMGWKTYINGFSMTFLGLAFFVFGLLVLSWRPNPFATVGALFSTLLGLAIIVLVWFTFIYGTINIWRRWRQLRQPAGVIDADGVRYLAVRRGTQIPWADVEEISLKRTLLPGSVVTKVSVRLTPEARALREGPVNVSSTRYLNLGLMSDLDIPEDLAVSYLEETAGPRLKVTETDRRTPSATHGYS